MIRLPRRRPRHLHPESGQSALLIFLFIFVLLLGLMGFATDYAQLFARRQMAQAAADAACQAGAADLFIKQTNSTYNLDYSWIPATAGTGAFDCSSNSGSPPCVYASRNGFSGSKVAVSFPSSVPGHSLSGFGTVTIPYIQVTITEPVGTSFSRLFQASVTSVNTGATAVCGLNPVAVPVPLVILHHTASGALSVSGSATIKIFGGPNRSVQVDSSSSTAVSVGTVDLSEAGPDGTGADFASFGGPTTKPAGINVGSTGSYVSPATPFGDPWVTVGAPGEAGAPAIPTTAGKTTPQPFGWNGCPDPDGCVELTAGTYTGCSTGTVTPADDGGTTPGCLMFPYSGSNPHFNDYAGRPVGPVTVGKRIKPAGGPGCGGGSRKCYFQAETGGTTSGGAPAWNATVGSVTTDTGGVTWRNIGYVNTNPKTAIFAPGLYYVGANGLNADQATLRMSTPPLSGTFSWRGNSTTADGDGTRGVTFYFSTAATVSVGSNSGSSDPCTAASSGSATPNNCVVAYNVDGTTSSSALGEVPMRPLQCPGGDANPSQVYLKPDNTSNSGNINGNIVLGPCSGTYGSSDGKNRGFLFFQSRSTAATPSWGGGGEFLLSGFMYFHQSSSYGTTFSLSGGSGAGAFTLGNIVADKVSMVGNSGIRMILNPASTFNVLKPQLLQ
jgi:hypothetical protein